jgi:Protein of unknown function (DUF3574)
MKTKSLLFAASLLAFAVAARVAVADAPQQATAALHGDAARPPAAQWLRSELYFGIGDLDISDGGMGEMRWRAFLDREVTPRFPDGLTVLDAYGQWLDHGKKEPNRLRSKVLVILHEDTPANREAIDAIRLAWKKATHDQSVLLATGRVDVSF